MRIKKNDFEHFIDDPLFVVNSVLDFSNLGMKPVFPSKKSINMEIRVYRNFEARTNYKSLYVARVECPDTFSFERALSVFKSIYGSCIVEFLCV